VVGGKPGDLVVVVVKRFGGARLLPHPGGVEGFGRLVREGLETKVLAVSDLKENPNWLIERHPAPPAIAQHYDSVSQSLRGFHRGLRTGRAAAEGTPLPRSCPPRPPTARP
jgi:hypothetical protein